MDEIIVRTIVIKLRRFGIIAFTSIQSRAFLSKFLHAGIAALWNCTA